MMRWIFRAYFAAVSLVAALPIVMCSAPFIEGWTSPVSVHQMLPGAVERTSDNRLCWTRTTTKLRSAEPWNYDVFLDRPWNHDRSFPEVRDRWTGQSWHTAGTLAAGQTRTQAQCIALPTDLKPGEPITLAQTIHYPGFRGWWDLSVPLPTISYTVPGEPAHDHAPTAPDTSEATPPASPN